MNDSRKDSSPGGTMISHGHGRGGSRPATPSSPVGPPPPPSSAPARSAAVAAPPAVAPPPPVATPRPASAVGGDLVGHTLLDRYFVLSRLGEGGMGTVYLAEHTTIQKKFAIKVLSQEYAHKPDLVERFLQEARAASMINQENVVEISDFGDTPDGSVFFVMEYLDGEDLSATVRREKHLPWPRVRNIMLQVCRALQSAHDAGIIHRDMKPENCFRIKRGRNDDFIKVLDFGIAKLSGQDESGGKGLTRTGMIFGTPEYMSPEQAQGTRPDNRVDIYALGVIMYELLTGRVPFTADTFMGILTKHMFEVPERPSAVAPQADIPEDAEAIVLKAMQKDREYRFQSMTEMADAIERVGGGDGPVAVVAERIQRPPASMTTFDEAYQPPKTGRGLAAMLVIAVALGGGGVVGYRYLEATAAAEQAATEQAAAERATVEQAAAEQAAARQAAANQPDPPQPAEPADTQPVVLPPDAPMVTFWISTEVDAKILDARDGGIYGMTNSDDGVKVGKSEEALSLILRAPGYDDLSFEIVPNSDKRFEHRLTRKRSTRKKSSSNGNGSKADDKASEDAPVEDLVLPSLDKDMKKKKPPGLHAPDLKDPFKH